MKKHILRKAKESQSAFDIQMQNVQLKSTKHALAEQNSAAIDYVKSLQNNVRNLYNKSEAKQDNSFLSQISRSLVKTTEKKKTRTNARSSTSKTERKDYARELIAASDYDRNAISLMYCNRFNQARNSTILTLLSDAKAASQEQRFNYAFREFSLDHRAYELKCVSCEKMFFTFDASLERCASCS